MSFATIADLRGALGTKPKSEGYATKMLHPVPDFPVVERLEWVVARVKGKRVLEFGASGPMHTAVVASALEVIGVDRKDGDRVIGFDLDDVTLANFPIPSAFPEIILCGEVVEHLSNPGWFLTRLKRQYPGVPVLVTVPNGLSQIASKHIAAGVENVNQDHVAWYSWMTLTTLLGRAGYTARETFWYHGPPRLAEGLIVVAE